MSDAASTPEAGGPSALPKPATAAPKPAAAAKPPAKGKSRRFFLFTWFGLAWTAFTVTMSAMTLATVRFMWPNVSSEPPSTFKAGLPAEFEQGVDERFKDKFGVWIIKQGTTMFALSTTCTHLGCTPNWLGDKFKCPCHGSGFRPTGINFEGPAPRPLERYKISVGDDGQIVVDKSRKFQFELGQWSDPEASIKV